MSTARDLMHPDVECIGMHDTLDVAARRMRDLDVGSLPVCGDDDQLHGMITDRDIVVRCLAEGQDPTVVAAADLAQETIYWIQADADERDVLATMEEHQIRRLPVIEDHRLVGIISEADLARQLPADKIAEFTSRVYASR